MGKDDRLYGKFTQDFADNPKILPLSDAAFRCLVEATLYSRRMLTDGFLATRLATAKWPLDALDELASNDPLKPSFLAVDGGWMIHDYAEHQDTKAEVEARRSRNAANGKKGGEARAKRLASDSPSEIQAETETEKEEEKKKTPALRPDVSRLCEILADLIEGNGSKRPVIGKAWLDAARLLIDNDKRPLAEAIALMQWAQADSFWKSNILGMPKFREKYDTVRLQRESRQKPKGGGSDWALRQ